MTLRDLLAHKDFGLDLIVGGQASLDRPIRGAHSIEAEHPAQWLDARWVMLTTGLRLSGDAEAQREYVREADEARLTALGFQLSDQHPEIPEAMVDEARRRDLPLFRISPSTALREIIGAVYREVLSDELRTAHRQVALQRMLLDAIGQESPRATLLARLALLTEADAAVIRADGAVLAGAVAVPGDCVAERLRNRRATTTEFEVGPLHGFAAPLDWVDDEQSAWLVITRPLDRGRHPLTKAAVQAAVPLFGAMAKLTHMADFQERSLRRATLESLLQSQHPEDARLAALRAGALGMKLDDGARVVVVVRLDTELPDERLLQSCETVMRESGVLFLACLQPDYVCALVPAGVSTAVLEQLPLAAGGSLRIGVGRAVSRALDVNQSCADAVLAVGAESAGGTVKVVWYDDLDLPSVILNELPVERIRGKAAAWLEPLRDQRALLPTLMAYLENDLDIAATAHAIGVHPNSVRYRLARAEEVMGKRVRSPSTLLALHVALFGQAREELLGDEAPSNSSEVIELRRLERNEPSRRARTRNAR